MIAIPNIDKPKSCTECPFEVIGISGYPRCVIVQEMVVDGNLFNRCQIIEIDDTVWENEKYKLIRMTQAVRINKEMTAKKKLMTNYMTICG